MNSYIRCKKCSFVYSSELDKCPECGTLTPISEEAEDSTIFNIND